MTDRLFSCELSHSTDTRFAHHEIEIGYGIFLSVQWGFSVYLCLAKGKSYTCILAYMRVLILHL